MLLEDLLGGPTRVRDPDASPIQFGDLSAAAKATPKAELLKLRDEGGGLKLAYRMMTVGLSSWCWVIMTVTKPLWDWYTEQTTQIKSPRAMLEYNETMALKWAVDAQFRSTFKHSLYTLQSCKDCGVRTGAGADEQRTIRGLLELSCAINGERAWSMASRHSVPLESYAAYFGGSHARRASVVDRMAAHASKTYWLDQRRLVDADALELWNDWHPIHSKPVRTIWAFFERDGAESPAGQNLLKGCVHTLADNKGVEELHKYGKSAAKKKAQSKKMNPCHLQHALTRTGILEKREIRHDAAVSKQAFLRQFRARAQFKSSTRSHYASSHKLDAKWSTIMGPKSWTTTSEVTGRVSASAWYWLCAMTRDEPFWLGRLSRWILPMTIFIDISVGGGGGAWASLLRGKWSALAWPLVGQLQDGTQNWRFATEDDVGASWITVRDIHNFEVIPYTEILRNDGVELIQRGPTEPLGKGVFGKAQPFEPPRFTRHGEPS